MRYLNFRTIQIANVIVCAVLGVWIAYMITDTEDPYDYDVTESKVMPNPAMEGSRVTADWALKKVNRVCDGISYRTLFDPYTRRTVFTYDPSPVATGIRRDDKKLSRTFTLPIELPEFVGYHSKVCFKCNLWQQLFPNCIYTPDLFFKTIEAPEPPIHQNEGP